MKITTTKADHTIKLWDLITGKQRYVLPHRLTPPPRHILEGHAGQVNLWNIESGDLLQTFTGNLGEVRSVAFSPDGKLLASGGDDLEIKLWKTPD